MTDSHNQPKNGPSSRMPLRARGTSRRREHDPDRRDQNGDPAIRGKSGDPAIRGQGADSPDADASRHKAGRAPRRDEQLPRQGKERGDERAGSGRRGGGDDRLESRPVREGFAESAAGRPRGAVGALIELDRDLMKLLARRAVLVARIRQGRDHASSAEAAQAEKTVRTAWENNALSFSKDPRFIRQLFILLQDLKVLTKEQSERASIFTLSPQVRPVFGELTGPSDTRSAQMYTALAACRGETLALNGIVLSESLLDTIKTFSQAGAAVSCHSQGVGLGGVRVARGAPAQFAGKTIYLGEDMFNMCLVAFLAVARPGTSRLAGGARLKGADLSFLRHVLPLLGARLAHVVPRSQSLPAILESSGELPAQVDIPADLPLEAVCALLLAPVLWNSPVVFNLAALPAAVATAALAAIGPPHLACGAETENRGSRLVYTPGPLHLPPEPVLPLDPVFSAYLLSLPAFAGGSLSLKGRWSPLPPESAAAGQLLSWAGVSLRVHEQSVSAHADRPPFALPLQCHELSLELGPLFLALAARQHLLAGAPTPLARLAPFPMDEMHSALVRDFFERLDITLSDGVLHSSSAPATDHKAARAQAWTCPDAFWGMAYALASLLRPGLRLANPGCVTNAMPPFWGIYNTLPSPADPARAPREKPQETADDKPARRRVIAD